jgi:phospholipid/cholesterol/gamma-HCH transport system permease protein
MMNSAMHALGSRISMFIEGVFAPLQILPLTISSMVKDRKLQRKSFHLLFVQHVRDTGVTAIPIILITGLATGILSVMLFPFDQISFGIENVYGSLYSTFILRELAPLVTTMIVIVRSTLPITIQLSNMKKNGELQILEIMGINPVQYLGSMRVYAGLLVVPALTIYFSLAALVSGMMTTLFFYRIPATLYIQEILATTGYNDIIILLIKTGFAGLTIFIIAIYNGLSGSEQEINIAGRTIRSIITSITVVLFFNITVSLSVYGS